MARDLRNEIDKNGAHRRRRSGRANPTPDSNQTNCQQPQAHQDITADSPPIAADTASTVTLTLSPGSPNSHSGKDAGVVSVPRYPNSECACHRLADCPGLFGVECLPSGRKSLSSVSARYYRRT